MYDENGRRNPKWTYVKGRNQFRSRVSFQRDDFEEFTDSWAMMAKPGEGPMKEKVDVFMVWNAEQEKANAVIMKKLKSLPGMDGQVKKTLLRGLQTHVERRLWEGSPDGAVGELAGLPGMLEELYEAFAGPLPSRRKHLFSMGGIVDNMYPEELVPLRNPKTSEPLVSVEVQKMIFPPDEDKPHDGERVVRSDEVWAPCHVCSCLSVSCYSECNQGRQNDQRGLTKPSETLPPPFLWALSGPYFGTYFSCVGYPVNLPGVYQQNSHAAVCDHTQQHCYFADMAYETKHVYQQNSNAAALLFC